MKKIATIALIIAFIAASCDTTNEFTADDFNIAGLSQLWDGDPKTVDITPKEGMSAAITIFYNYSRTPPSRPGRYRVTFNADAAGFKAARGLPAGTLAITLVTDSASVLRTQLIYAYKNTIDYPIPVKLDIELSSYRNCMNIIAESDRFVELDLSDATGTAIVGQPFSEIDYYSKVVSIVLPSGLHTLGDFALANLSAITHLNLSTSSITHIGDYTFLNSNLEKIVLPLHLEEISSFSFFNSRKLKSITIPDSVISIGEWSFNSTGIKNLKIGSGVNFVGRQAFYDTALTSVTFSGLIAEFEGSVFTFPGDLQEKYLAGGIGTYTRPNANSNTWSKK